MAALYPHHRVVPAQRGPAPSDVKKAVDYMRQGMAGKITTINLAEVSGVAPRTLCKHFRAFVGVSPLAYLRRLRLTAVREELLKGADNYSITELAARYGFNHFGRFSVQYRRCFGEAPSTTLRRARSDAGKQAGQERAKHLRNASNNLSSTRLSRETPSLLILPCETSGTDAVHQCFAQHVAEGVAAALCRASSISVLVHSSSRAAVCQDPKRLARELGAQYFLTGRLALSGHRVRITMRLLHATTKAHVWGDSYDGDLSYLFGLQDRVTKGVVGAIPANIRGAEIERARRKRPEDLNAYDITMRAFPFALTANPVAARRALELLENAMEIDPDYALAAALAAWCHAQLIMHNGTRAPAVERAQALLLAERADILGTNDPLVLTARCAVHTMAREFEVADALLARALALDPTSAWAWERSGWLKTYMGESETAIGHFHRAIWCDPSSPSNANRYVGIGSAHFDAGRYDQGAVWMRQALLERPATAWVNRTLAVSYARLGQRPAALDSIDAFRRYWPDATVGQVVASIPFKPDFLGRVAAGLSELGLPL
jgi:adenylate cyclase